MSTKPRKSNKLSRPERRAEQRLNSATEAYKIGQKVSKIGGKEYTKPGSKKHY